MAIAKLHKVVASLPETLEADSVYFVRVGTGFDIYVTNGAGQIVAYTLNLPAGAATGACGLAEVDFGAGASQASVAITGQASIGASSAPIAQLMAKATTDHSVDEHLIEEMDVFAGNVVNGVGFTVYAKSRNVALRGKYSVVWSWR